ncbi:MAG TPA: hypothetical protein PK821_00665 [Victivallales bacterium]|nr:hypothetical protein [Victivallales bacterium]
MRKRLKNKKLRFVLRVIFYSTLSVVIIILGVAVVFETIGLPSVLEKMILKEMLGRGFSLNFQNARAGIVSGLVLENASFEKKLSNANVQISAKKICVSLDYLPDFELKISDVEVVDANVEIKTSQSEEDKEKIFVADQVNGHAIIGDRDLEIEYLNLKIRKIPFSISGKIKNFSSLKRTAENIKKRHKDGEEDSFKSQKQAEFNKNIIFFEKFFSENEDECSVNANFEIDLCAPSNKMSIDSQLKLHSLKISGNKLSEVDLRLRFQTPADGENMLSSFSALIDGEVKSSRFLDLDFDELGFHAAIQSVQDDPDLLEFKDGTLLAKSYGIVKFDALLDKKTMDFDANLSLKMESLDPNGQVLGRVEKYGISSVSSRNQLSINGSICGNIKTPKFISSEMQFSADGFQLKGQKMDKIHGRLILDDQILKGKDFIASINDTGVIRSGFNFSIPDKALQADAEFVGNMDFILEPGFLGAGEGSMKFLSPIKFSPLPEESRLKASVFMSVPNDAPMHLFAKAELSASKLQFDDMIFDSVSCEAMISSEGIVIIPSLRVSQSDNSAVFSALFDDYAFEDKGISSPLSAEAENNNANPYPVLFFELKSNVDGDNLLKIFFPGTKIGWLNFAGKTNKEFRGKINFAEERLSSMYGRVEEASVAFYGISVEKTTASVVYENETLMIKKLHGILYGGNIELDLNYDFHLEKGWLKTDVKDAGLTGIAKALDHKEYSRYSGNLDVSGETKFFYDDSGVMFDGAGKMKLKDCQVLGIPVLSDMLNVTGQKIIGREWGEITEVSAAFSLKDRRIASDDITTNGKFIGLQGYGYYDWAEDSCDFRVRARPLQVLIPRSPLSIFTDALLSVIEARYRGRGDKKAWEPSTSVIR